MQIAYPPDISKNNLFRNKKAFHATLYFDHFEFDEIHSRILIPAFLLDTNKIIQNSAMIVLTNNFADRFKKLMEILDELPVPKLFALTGEFYFNEHNLPGCESISFSKIEALKVGGLSIYYNYWQDDMLAEHLSNIFY